LVVLFVHDLEKPWAYEEVGGARRRGRLVSRLASVRGPT
jgi:hypothetical protein